MFQSPCLRVKVFLYFDWSRLFSAYPDPNLVLDILTHLPRLMYYFCRDIWEFRKPQPNIVALWIILVSLFDSIELEDLGRSKPRGVEPPKSVGMHIMINQVFFEMSGTGSPILLEVHGQEIRQDLSSPVWNIARVEEFTHQRIYYRESSGTQPPSSERVAWGEPRDWKWVCKWTCLPEEASLVLKGLPSTEVPDQEVCEE